MFDKILQENYELIIKKFNEYAIEYLQTSLSSFGYYFNSREDFLEFSKTSIKRIVHKDKPYYSEFYINYIDENNKGTLIGVIDTNINIEKSGNEFIITIGKQKQNI